ncbi:MAG: HlyD family efflux transporter periplasmic adaptor subunit [Clostridia bacterium]|nr:HlyD family efflux transporter periplasmic adaptor subunit [Clostridia bacterium]MBN2883751.1 HlyD family efflux transporter periplasmic adaptor subunit [Clostridia bacterium]
MSKNKAPISKKKKKKVLRITIVSVVVIALVAGGIIFLPGLIGAESETGPVIEKNTAIVMVGDISKSISASAPIMTSQRLAYKPDSTSEILEILIAEGGYAAAGDTVIVLDTSSADNNIISLEESIEAKNDSIDDKYSSINDLMEDITDRQESIAGLREDISEINEQISDNEASRVELTVMSPMSGAIFGLKVKPGDYVSSGTVIATVTDTSSYEIEMTFSAGILESDIESAKVFYLNNEFEGKIVSIAGYTYKNQSGMELVDVVIAFDTTIVFEKTSGFSGRISTALKDYNSIDEEAPYYADTEQIIAGVTGEILEIYIIEKQSVTEGEAILLLDGESIDSKTETLNNQIESIQSQIDGLNDQIESYNSSIKSIKEDITDLEEEIMEFEEEIEEVRSTYENAYIKADFNGVVTDMNAIIGDLVNTNTSLFTLVSMENPNMVVAIDELDIAEVSEGLEVSVAIDALYETEEKPVNGYVSKIALEGDSQGGVTTYNVTISLLETPEGFRLGMNATATIYTSKSDDTLYLPIEAITIQNGRSFVYLVDETVEGAPVFDVQPSTVTEQDNITNDDLTNIEGTGGGGRGSQDPSAMTEEELAAFEARLADKGMTLDDYYAQQEAPLTSDTVDPDTDELSSELNDYYNGTRIVEVTTGIYNALYIEILSGLEVGDEVVLPPVYVSSNTVTAEESGIIGLPAIPGTGTGGGGGGTGRSSGSLTGGE